MSNINHFIEECVYCDSQFTVTTDDDDEVIFCPFCGEEMFDDDDELEYEDEFEDDDYE
jgi:hypothetical protein